MGKRARAKKLIRLRYVAAVLIIAAVLTGFLVQMGKQGKPEVKGKDVKFFPSEEELDLDALVDLADTILVGNVSNITIVGNYSCINISVSEYIKSPMPNMSIIVKMFQGIEGPSFTIGERVILFLTAENDYFVLASLGQGKDTIEIDPKTGREVLIDLGVYLDDYVAQIKSITAETLYWSGTKTP